MREIFIRGNRFLMNKVKSLVRNLSLSLSLSLSLTHARTRRPKKSGSSLFYVRLVFTINIFMLCNKNNLDIENIFKINPTIK